MTRIRIESNWISRLWSVLTEASSAAVAIHYAAPWEQPTPHNDTRLP